MEGFNRKLRIFALVNSIRAFQIRIWWAENTAILVAETAILQVGKV